MFIAAPASAHLHILKPNERRLLKTNLLIFKQNLEHFFAFQIKCKLIYKFQRFNIFRKLTLFFFHLKHEWYVVEMWHEIADLERYIIVSAH